MKNYSENNLDDVMCLDIKHIMFARLVDETLGRLTQQLSLIIADRGGLDKLFINETGCEAGISHVRIRRLTAPSMQLLNL